LASRLEEGRWDGSALHLGAVEFEVRIGGWEGWEPGPDRFRVLRTRDLIESYAKFWSTRPAPRKVLEIGIWDGGSAVFWTEALEPEKYVGLDYGDRGDSEHLKSYVETRGLTDRLKTYWGVDQADQETLRGIAEREFDSPIDVVIDDASHFYEPTLASFEVLLPLLRPGGLYIIEDWQWSYRPRVYWPHGAETAVPVSRLVRDLVDLVGRGWKFPPGQSVVESLTVYNRFTAVEKGQ
jgi:predicted O-methyltransferase YrrM